MRRQRKKRKLSGFLALLCALTLAGCGQEAAETTPETVELLEPVGSASAWEEVVRRDLYDAKVYAGAVLPYVEEYEFSESRNFASYSAYPGDEVKMGGALLSGDTKALDEQIEAMEKALAEMDEAYQEYVKDTEEALKKPRENVKIYGEAIERLEKSRPEQYIADKSGGENETENATESETVNQIENPEYTAWKRDYDYCDSGYRDAWLLTARLEQGLKERTELYELDRDYNASQLEKLKKRRRACTLTSEIPGTVVAMQYYGRDMGSWDGMTYIRSGIPLMAVADLGRKRVCCEFINEIKATKAADLYAFINGKRYEVTYEPPEDEAEVRSLIQSNIPVYSTFWLEDAEDVEIGDFAVIALVSQKRENVISIPRTALYRDEGGDFVYVRNGSESVYTPVKTGLYEGLYVEILSGLNEGDQVLVTQGSQPGKTVLTLEKGEIQSSFEDSGELYYSDTTEVLNPVKSGTCYCVEMPVLYQQVEKGQVIARIKVEPDENAIARLVRQIQRAKERLADYKAGQENPDEEALAQRQKAIDELEKELADIRADAAVTEIKAPVSGIIINLASYEEGSRMENDEAFCVIADAERVFIRVTDDNGQLQLGSEVTVEYQNKLAQTAAGTGEVVTVNRMGVSPELRSGWALIRLPRDVVEDMSASYLGSGRYWNLAWFRVSAVTRTMEDVILIPKAAVTESAGSTYVDVKMPDGSIERKSFLAGGSDSKNYWVLEGLAEGMEICSE
ncbi:MAG: efflux RND transporter periplasmic adaptor subunit [Roseburia sp.]|nr:efflux RND transporter periplasmic adaptor subunit [Roseburia sp.]MCM1097101.1 efflux RND transporter periplasmic adaptor subunit [Ruminococcus flavefaciens]